MKVVELRGYHVECKLPEPVRNAVSRFDTRGALVVELVCDSGLSGWGECTQTPAAVWSFIETNLAMHVLGSDPRPVGRLWRNMLGPRAEGDIAMMALSAVDMALWDLRGRGEGVPVATLLGGRLRDRVKAYASGPFMRLGADPYDGYVREIEGYLAAGFAAVKARIGASPRSDARLIGALRRHFGAELTLMVDMNRGYARPAASDAIRGLDEHGLLWIEEPIGADDLAGYAALARHTRTPLAAGEALAKLGQFRDLLASGAVGVVQPDLYLCGGFTGALKIAALAEAHETPYVPHVWGTAINFHASLQLAAVLPASRLADGCELPMFEWDRSDNALLRVAGEPALADDGTLAVPDAPGIGVEIDRAQFAPFVKRAWQLTQ